MNRIEIMIKQVISYRFRKQARLLALAALFLAPFWTWGQTSTQNGRKQGRGLFGLLMMAVFVLRARKMQDECRKNARGGAEESKHWMGWQAARMAAVLGVMMVWTVPMMAQSVPDGVYYIRNNNSVTHGYLWPSVTTYTTTGYRYLTTSLDTIAPAVDNNNGVSYPAHDKSYSHWVVKNVTGGYIQLINPRLNKYVVIRKFPKANNTKTNEYGDRDVWLTDEPATEDIEYSYFKLNNNNSPYKISPKAGLNGVNTTSNYSLNSASGDDRVWLTWSKSDDKPQNGEGREGLIQLYSGGTPLWSFTVDLLDAPTISDVNETTNTITITDVNSLPDGYTIRYTTNGTTPTDSTGNIYSGPISVTANWTVKAVVVRYGLVLTEVAQKAVSPVVTTPVITFNNSTNLVTISCSTPGAVIYYNTGNGSQADPPTGSTPYDGPFAIYAPTTVKAISSLPGFGVSDVASLAIAKVATPTIQDNGSNAISITCTTPGATIYYTTDGSNPTTSSTQYIGPLTENVSNVTIKAIAVKENMIVSEVGSGSVMLQCATPVITRVGLTFTLSCSMPTDASLYYTLEGGSETTYSGPVSFTTDQLPLTVTAVARHSDYLQSEYVTVVLLNGTGTPDDPFLIYSNEDFSTFVDDVNNGSTASACYELRIDISVSGVGAITADFSGTFDGGLYTIADLSHPLFNVVDGGTVRNVILKDVSISGSGNVGAIVNTAKGSTKVYNCGILSGSVSGGTNTGGLVGLIEAGSSVRVVNCYNFANVTGGGTDTYAAGIVGKNEGTVGAVRIALCMMYGNVTGASNISPVYCGNHVSNSKNFTEYNYWRYRSGMEYTAYNDQMAIEKDDFLTRFPFYRHILNTHRELAAYFLFAANTTQGSVADIAQNEIDEIGHWALKKGVAPYPIIEPWETNTRKVLDANPTNLVSDSHLPTSLSVRVMIGTEGMATGCSAIDQTVSLPVTDMDEDNYDYTYGKVVLPFANEFSGWTPDYSKICTGWKITNVSPASQVSFEHYNVSDRKCTAKDLYDTTGFIFAQGGNYIVPYDVTDITIEANFATAYYLCDESYDIAYEKDGTIVPPHSGNTASGYMNRTTIAGNTPDTYHDQHVFHTFPTALDSMSASGTTHAQAIVLVGNYHLDDFDLELYERLSKGYTFMSIDADKNQEPDYAIYSNYTIQRPKVPPMRYDFVAFIPLGMSSHVTNAFFYPNTPIWKPRGWFEITETGLMWANQFEIESDNFNTSNNDTRNYRCIINGGYFTQMVRSFDAACTKLSYYQVGGNAYVKEFYPGNHSDKNKVNKLVPINVTGGEIEQCFMTGYGKGTVTGSDIYFWCAGGKIGKFLGSYMEKPTTEGVNMTAKIDHAIIGRFFGGGTTQKARITGNIHVTIDNSRVDFYCGGPEFGNMEAGKTVTTHATNTTFGEYYGAGFGGTAITYRNDKDDGNVTLGSSVPYPSNYFTTYYCGNNGRLSYVSGYGLGNCYKFEYIMHSRGHRGVARFYTGFASFSLATTGTVTNVLDSCTVLRNFFGAGCQGKVNGTVTSTLTDCTVLGSAYGGGYKATANEVEVFPTTAPTRSIFTGETGIFSDFGTVEPEIYTWQQGKADPYPHDTAYQDQKYLYTGTDVILSDLGNVTNDIKITLDGKTTVMGSVFGGGYESKSLSNTEVQIYDRTKVFGNIYGGGNMGKVSGDTKVIINGTVPDETPTGNANNNNPNH